MQVTRGHIIVLLVRSELEKTPLTILPHEIPILENLHPACEVRVVEDAEVPIPAKTFDTEEEYANLQEKYRGSGDNGNPTTNVFRNLEEFEAGFEGDDGSSGDDAEAKAKLLEEAKGLGIKANKNWGVAKLQEAIDAKLAE